MLKVKELNTELVAARHSEKLKLYVGPGRQFEVSEASDVTGIGEHAIQSYRRGENGVPIANFLKLAGLINCPAYLDAMLSLIGYRAVPTNPEMHCPFDLISMFCQEAEFLTQCMKDQNFDHREKLEAIPRLRAAGNKALEMAAALEKEMGRA